MERHHETRGAHQAVPIIALPRSSKSQIQDLQHRYGDRYRIVSVGHALTGWKSERILVLTEALLDQCESTWHHDWVDYQLACRLLPKGKMIEITWDPRAPGRIIFAPMRRSAG